MSETSSGSEASSSTRVVPSAKAAATLDDEWANRLSPKKRRLMLKAVRIMQGNLRKHKHGPLQWMDEAELTTEERGVWTAWMKEEEEKEKQRELRDLARMDSRGPTTTEDHAKTQDATMTEHDAELLAFMIDPDAYVLARG